MNKDGGGSLDLLNIRTMAKVCFIKENQFFDDLLLFFSLLNRLRVILVHK
jgi:hypothetical protein